MDYQDYDQRVRQVAASVDSGKFDEAIPLLHGLIDSDLPDLDKSMMCINMAVTYDHKGRVDEALAWYDRGIAYEAVYFRFFVTEHKAAYLHRLKRYAESLAIYEQLLDQSFTTAVDNERFRANIAIIRPELG